jgi:ABC-type nickel/cobalt efflux system permease component RcnA
MVSVRGMRVAVLLLAIPAVSQAHPIPERTYDRRITVRITPSALVVDYVLEINSFTASLDLKDRLSLEEFRQIGSLDELYGKFLDVTAPRIGETLLARLDGKDLTFERKPASYGLVADNPAEDGNESPPDRQHSHLRCKFRFQASWKLKPGQQHKLHFREPNYDGEKGAIDLSLVAEKPITLLKVTQPDDELKKRASIDLRPGDEERLRTVKAMFQWSGEEGAPPKQAESEESTSPEPHSLVDLLFETRRGLWVLLGLAAFLGAVHALTPGHGKTLVAAYLVGERGTVGHAVLLGIVTALTHTGAVLLVAACLTWFFPRGSEKSVEVVLSFLGGLMIAALGFWMLLRRLSGQADHFHLIGGHHHHHHGAGHDHHHLPTDRPVRLRELVWLGIAGGILPCGEALALLLAAVNVQRLDYALPLLLAFSAGLAGVLVAVGVGVVYTRQLAVGRWIEEGRLKRLARVLPIVSALIVTALGIGFCYHSLTLSPRR